MDNSSLTKVLDTHRDLPDLETEIGWKDVVFKDVLTIIGFALG
jgi:hypothetical protein